MTNMPENAPFGNFGIVLAAICIPFFSIIGFLSTKYGYSIWAQKTKELWRWIHPKKKREKLGDDEDVTQPPGPVNRTLSTEEGMRLRLKERDREHLRPRRRSTHRPPPSHPHIQRMVEKMGEGRESGLVRMGTVAEDKNSNAGTVQPGIRRGDTVITIQEP